MIKAISFATLGVLSGAITWIEAPVQAQSASGPVNIGQNSVSANATSGTSLTALLQLQPAQVERLSRLYADYNERRLAQESKIASGQNQLGQRDRARQKITADLSATRLKARLSLPPVQRSQLDSLAGDSRFRLRADSIYQLLLAPVAESALPQQARDTEARRNWLDARQMAGENDLRRAGGVGSYGVYGGYGYGGPQTGVYGGYNQGPVGVHAGIGLGGPTVGISIGRVFGIGRR